MTIERGWPIVGRAHLVDEVVERLTDRDPACIELVGAAGVGKSSVAGQCTDRLRADGIDVGWISASPVLSDVPLGAFAPYIDQRSVPMAPGADLFGQLVADACVGSRRPVLVADDVQWLDPESVHLLGQLADDGAIGLLTTRRTEAAVPAAATPTRGFTTVEVGTLDRPSCDALVRAALDGAVDPDVLDLTWRLTRGVALHVREFINAARRARALRHDGPWWTFDASLFDAGESLRDLLEGRLRALEPGVRHAVDLVAHGDPIANVQLEAAVGAAMVERAIGTGLVSVTGDRLTISHPLYGEILRGLSGKLAHRRLLGDLIASFPAVGDPAPWDLAMYGRWLLDTGALPDAEALPLAKSALDSGDLALAERLARLALAAGPSFDAWATLGHSVYRQGALDEAAVAFGKARDLAEADDDLVSMVSMQFAAYCERPIDARRSLDEGRALAEARGLDVEHWFATQMAWHAMAVSSAGQALALAEPLWADRESYSGETPELALLMWMASAACGQITRLAEFEPLLSPEGATATGTALILDPIRAWYLALQGNLSAASTLAAATATWARDAGSYPSFWAELSAAQIDFLAGRLTESAGHLRLARRFAGDRSIPSCYVGAALLETGLLIDDPELRRQGRSLLDRVTAVPAEVTGRTARAEALEMAVAGATVTARADRLRGALPGLIEAGYGTYETEVYDELTFLGVLGVDELDRLETLSAQAGGPGREALTGLAGAVLARDASGAAEAATTLDQLGLPWLAARAYETASRAALARHGQDAAAPLAERSRALGASVGIRPELLAPPTAFLGLSARERAVLQRRAAGSSIAMIADDLGIKVATVDHLIDRACARTGSSSRDELLGRWAEAWGTTSPTLAEP